jgi:hypothetical protein
LQSLPQYQSVRGAGEALDQNRLALVDRPTTARRTGAGSTGSQHRAAVRSAPGDHAPIPTIRVSIGRIEVRATTALSAKPPARQEAPVMRLEEYLQQRNRGQL